MEGVFAADGNGTLRLAADWDALYRAEPDPWGQSGADERLGPYYRESRARLVRAVHRNFGNRFFRGLEIGAGHGHVVDHLGLNFPNAAWSGLEISPTAVEQAAARYPRHSFHAGDVTDSDGLPWLGRYDLVIFGQVWWYVLERMHPAISTARRLLEDGGLLMVSQGFLAEQRYGNELAEGFVGALDKLANRFADLRLVGAEYDAAGCLALHDGLIVLRKGGASC